MVLCGGAVTTQEPATTLTLERTIGTGKVGIRAAHASPMGCTLLAGTFDGQIQVWDTATWTKAVEKRGDVGGFG